MRFHNQNWSNATFNLNAWRAVFIGSKSFFGTCMAIVWLGFLNILHLQQIGGICVSVGVILPKKSPFWALQGHLTRLNNQIDGSASLFGM
jgi:hypothetical protein